MKEEIREVLDFKVPMSVYESVEEGDKDANRIGAILAEANNNLLYRGTYNQAREVIVAAVIGITGVEQATKDTGEKDAKGQPILAVSEKDSVYVTRALAAKGLTIEQINDQIVEACRAADNGEGEPTGLRADIRARARTPGGAKKLAKTCIDAATQVFDAGAAAKAAAKIEQNCGHVTTLTGEKAHDIEALGWAIKANEDWKRKQQVAELIA